MKRHLSFIMLLALMLSIFSLGFAITVQVGADGYETTGNFPVVGSFRYSYTQQIYTQSQINCALPITKIRFYYSVGPIDPSKDWTIYMGHTQKTSFTSNSDWEPMANLTQVFDGDVSSMLPAPKNWMEITLDTPFTYNNIDNLLVAVHEDTPSWQYLEWGAFSSGANAGLIYYNYDNNPDPNNPPAGLYRTSSISRIQLYSPDTTAPMTPLLVSPANGARRVIGESLSWTLPVGSAEATGYDVYIDGNVVSSNQPLTHYTITSALSEGMHNWYVVARNSIGDSPASATRSFLYVNGVLIGNGYSNSYHPFNADVGYARSLCLYTQDQIGQYGLITSLGWNVFVPQPLAIPYKIYAKLTTQSVQTPITWADFTSGATLVKQGSYSFSSAGWHDLALTTPFPYTEGNLLIGVEVNYGGGGAPNYSSPRFYCTPGMTGRHQTWGQDNTMPTGNGWVVDILSDVIILLSAIPTGPEVYLNPSEWDFGTVTMDDTATKTFSLSNAGTGTLNVTGISPISNGFFTITDAPTFPVALAEGQSTTFSVRYTPTVGGNHTATFTINAGAATDNFTVSGVCFDPTITSFPYLQNFDGPWSGTPAAPAYWKVINADNDSYTWRQTSGDMSPYSPPYTAFGAGNNDDWLISPPINLSGVNIRMKWWDRVEAMQRPNSYKVMLSTTTPEIASFTTELHDETCYNESWIKCVINLDAYTGQTIYLAFHQYESPSSDWGFGIEDFTLEAIPINPVFTYTPASMQFGAIRINNATAFKSVTVTNTGGETLNLTAADVSIIGPDAAMFEVSTINLPCTLSEDESRSIYVRYHPTAVGIHNATLRMVNAGANYDVALAGTALSETALLESFEGELFPPAGWRVHNGGGGNTWLKSTAFPLTGNAHAAINFSSVAHDDWLISPKLAPSAANHVYSFYGCNYSSEYDERFNVKVSTTSPDIASFTHTLATNVQTGALQYQHHYYDLSSFIGQEVYVAIQAISTDQFHLYIDDVSGPEIVPEAPATPVLVSPQNGQNYISVRPTLSWNSSPGATPTGYKVYLGTDNPPTTEVADLTTTQFTFTTALLPATVYYWTVKAYNEAGISAVATPFSFTTAAEGVVPVGSGTTYNSTTTFPAVYGGYYKNGREQYLVLASELTAAGAEAGWINSISFNVKTINASTSLPNFSIRIKATTATEFVEDIFFTDLEDAFSVPAYTPTFDWNQHSFNVPFYWDGQSNLVIQTSFDMQNVYAINAGVYNTNLQPRCGSLYFRSNNTAWQYSYAGTSSYYRPNMLLHIVEPVVAAPGAPVLDSPVNNATGVSKRGFELKWHPDISAGTPDHYTVYMSTNPSDIYNGFSWQTAEQSFNPIAQDANFSVEYLQRWYWTVRAHNALGEAVAELPHSFVIEADPSILSYPWCENFDTLTEGQMPEHWVITTSNGGTHPYIWRARSNSYIYYTSEPNAAVVNALNGPKDDWMITLPFHMQAGQRYDISFTLSAPGWEGVAEALKVHWATEPTPAAMISNPPLYDNNNILQWEWTTETMSFIPPSTGTYYFGWHAYSAADLHYIAVDDITITVSETLSAPVVQASISGSNVVLTWEPVSGATSYKVYASSDPYSFDSTPIATVNTNSCTLPLAEAKRFFKVISVGGRDFWGGMNKQ